MLIVRLQADVQRRSEAILERLDARHAVLRPCVLAADWYGCYLSIMSDTDRDRVRHSLRILENPYAFAPDGDLDEPTLAERREALGNDRGRVEAEAPPRAVTAVDADRLPQPSGNPYANVPEDEEWSAAPVRRTRVPTDSVRLLDTAALLGGRKRGDRFRTHDIDRIVRELHRGLWNRRGRHGSPFEILDPSEALAACGVAVRQVSSLGEMDAEGERSEVAGVIDRDRLEVAVSSRFAGDVQRFTLAHELGHFVLHADTGLHRDRAIDSSGRRRRSNPQEREADHFAAAFLMPEKLVRQEFESRFGTQRFELNEDSAFGLGDGSTSGSRRREGLYLRLARATHFHGKPFVSLAQRFQVSDGAMAIRLEELGLLAL